MENNAQRLNSFNPCFTGDYLETLLHGPNSSALMGEELKKINAHVIEEEAQMKNVIASAGLAVVLAIMAYLCYLPGIL